MGTDNEIITQPGKFEGQRRILRRAYETYLDGCADEDDGEVVTVYVDGATVRFIETDQGFIEEV